VGDQGFALQRLREELRVGVDERDPRRLLVEVEVLLPHPAVGEAHLTVVGGADHQRVVIEPGFFQLVEDVDHVVVGGAHQVAVEVQVVTFLLRGFEFAREIEDPQEFFLDRGLGRKVFGDRLRQADVPFQPGLVVFVFFEARARVEEDVVRVDQRDHHEEGLLLGRGRAQVLQRALCGSAADRFHEAAVVVDLAAPASGTVWLAPASGGSQRRKPYFSRSAGTASSFLAGFEQCHLPL
jgi:hypothetical protein